MKETTVYIADNHPLLAKGLADFLESNGYKVLGAATNGIKAYHEIIKLKPDLAVLDIEMPDMTGLQILEKIKETELPTRVIFYTIYKDQALLKRSFEAGLSGFLLKECELEEVLECINGVIENRPYSGKPFTDRPEEPAGEPTSSLLTPSELKILRYIAKEYSSKEIAERLFISERTVEKHRSNIIKKLELPPRKNALLLWAIAHCDISEP